MSTISHESMAGINEIDRNEVEFIKNEIGLEIYWIEKVYTEDEVGHAMDSMFGLIEEYFYLLVSNPEAVVNKELAKKENSPYYGFWNDYNFFSEFDIRLLNDKIDNSNLVQLLTRNINGDSRILFEFLKNFKLNHGKEK